MHGFYLPNTFMRDGVVANFGMDRTAGNIYGSLVFSGLNQIASKNKFVCYIKNV